MTTLHSSLQYRPLTTLLVVGLSVASVGTASPTVADAPANEVHAPPRELAIDATRADDPIASPGSDTSLGTIGRLIADAQPGSVVHVPPGVHRERVRVDRPLTLVGVERPVIDGGGSGDIVEIVAPGVTLRGFVIRNTGDNLDRENAAIRVLAAEATIEDNILEDVLFGIDLRQAPRSVIRNNRIGGKQLDIARRGDGLRLWRSDDSLIEGNVIHDGRDAVLWYSTGLVVRDNVSYRCRYGFHLMFSDEMVIEGNRLFENSVGLYAMYSAGLTIHRNHLVRNRGPSGYGLGLKEADRYSVTENLIAGNRVGVYLDGSPFSTRQPGVFERNAIGHNDVGMTFLPSVRGNEIVENNFIDNLEQISIAGRGNLDGNRFWRDDPVRGDRGNFWSDYTGYDQDRDGIGDFVHESSTLFERFLEREPNLRLFLHSPSQQAIEFVSRALPAIRPEPKFVDEVPLMRPVALDLGDPPPPGARLRVGLAGALLLAVGGGVLALATVHGSGGGIGDRSGTRRGRPARGASPDKEHAS